MSNQVTRRNFLAGTGTAALAATLTTAQATEVVHPPKDRPLLILGIACSPRKAMTTTKAVQAALDAAKAVNPLIEVVLCQGTVTKEDEVG